MNISLCWLANTRVSVCGSSQKNFANEFFLASSAVPNISCLSYLDGLWDARQVAIQLLFSEVLLPGICSKQYAASLCSFYLTFSPSFSLKSKWCTDITSAWKNSHFREITFPYDLAIVVYAFLMQMLTLLSLDEILLPSYVKYSTNFRGLSFNVEMAPICLKHKNSLLFQFIHKPMPLAIWSRQCNRDSAWVVYLLEALNYLHSLHLLWFL